MHTHRPPNALAPQDLLQNGCAVLRQAIAADTLPALCKAFDEQVQPSSQWPVPRDATWRFSMLDLHPPVQAICRLPALLSAVGQLIGEPFFLSQVEGREPLPGHGHQRLHRDLFMQRPGDTVNAIVFLDDYGPHNGATRLLAGSHRPERHAPEVDFLDESGAMQLSGQAGDVLVFDADLVHAGSLNRLGGRRRSLLLCYLAEPLRALHETTAALRNVRMDTRERFTPEG